MALSEVIRGSVFTFVRTTVEYEIHAPLRGVVKEGIIFKPEGV